MQILAIDTALEACSVAVFDTEGGSRAKSRSLPMARGHAEALMPLIATVMSDARTEFDELDRIAVTVGPGSFTGLRVGVAAARGIGLAAGKPVVGLTTLAAMAVPFRIDAVQPDRIGRTPQDLELMGAVRQVDLAALAQHDVVVELAAQPLVKLQ